MNSEIERLAKAAGWDVDGDGITMPYLSGYHDTADETAFLTKFAALIAEECAKEADSVAFDFGGVAAGPFVTDFGKHTKNSMAAGALNAAAAIRAKFALSGEEDAAK